MRSFFSGRVSILATLIGLACVAGDARADGPAPTPDVSRFASGRAVKSNVVPIGKTERYGHAEVLVMAPIEAVRHEVTSYNGYRDLAPDKFSRSRIIAKENNETDVYMQLPVMGGLVVLWQVMRFSPIVAVSAGVERLEGRYVRGNLKNAGVVYTLTQVDPRRTILKMDLLVLPNMAVPQSVVDEELRDAAATATEAMRDKAERRSRPSPAEVASAQPAPRPTSPNEERRP